MLKIIQKRLSTELTEEEASHLQQSLQTRYNSLLYKIRLEYLNRLGLEPDAYKFTAPPAGCPLAIGELFMPEPGTILYLKSLRGEKVIEAGVVTTASDRDFEEFFDSVRDVLGEMRSEVPSWTMPDGYTKFAVEDATAGNVNIEAKRMTAARALMDPEARDLLEKIRAAGSIFLNKIESTDRKATETCIHRFEELQLVKMDYAVLCRKTGQQILRVDDRRTIDESSQKAFKCFICGNQIADEVVEEILACTESGNELLKNQEWLLVLVQGILGALGISNDSLQVHNQPGSPMQLFLSLNGQRYILILCTTPIDLDQAYLIGAHISAYNLNQAVIISAARVSTLMRHHLQQTNPNASFHFIDDLNNLDAKLKDTLFNEQRIFLQNQLKDLDSVTPVNIPALVLRKMLPEATDTEKPAATPAAAAPAVAPIPAPAAPPVQAAAPKTETPAKGPAPIPAPANDDEKAGKDNKKGGKGGPRK